MNTPYGLSVDVDLPYDLALEKVTMKAKLDIDFRRYFILGACNPALAHRALSEELEIGLLLPCNLIVYERDGGGATISAMNALAAMSFTGNPALEPIAQEASARLERVLATVGS
jgi:uncharacterized protein (DUF302 family)